VGLTLLKNAGLKPGKGEARRKLEF
jgi:hypothetical protein